MRYAPLVSVVMVRAAMPLPAMPMLALATLALEAPDALRLLSEPPPPGELSSPAAKAARAISSPCCGRCTPPVSPSSPATADVGALEGMAWLRPASPLLRDALRPSPRLRMPSSPPLLLRASPLGELLPISGGADRGPPASAAVADGPPCCAVSPPTDAAAPVDPNGRASLADGLVWWLPPSPPPSAVLAPLTAGCGLPAKVNAVAAPPGTLSPSEGSPRTPLGPAVSPAPLEPHTPMHAGAAPRHTSRRCGRLVGCWWTRLPGGHRQLLYGVATR